MWQLLRDFGTDRGGNPDRYVSAAAPPAPQDTADRQWQQHGKAGATGSNTLIMKRQKTYRKPQVICLLTSIQCS